MAKPIKRKNTKNMVKVNATIDGKKVTIETNCKKFGKPVLNSKNEYQGNCKKCNKNSKVFKACEEKFKLDNPVVKTSGKKLTSNDDMKNAVEFIVANPSMNKKELIAKMAKNSKRSEGGWNTMIGAIRLSIKCLDKKGSGKGAFHWAGMGINSGITDKKALNAYVAKKEKKDIKLISGSVNHIFRTYNFLKTLKNAAKDATKNSKALTVKA